MAHAPCPDPDALERFLLGFEVGFDESWLEKHLAACARCSTQLLAVRAEDRLVWAVRGARSLTEPPRPELLRSMVPLLKCLRPREATQTWSSDTQQAMPGGFTFSFLGPPATPGDLGTLGPYRIRGVLGAGGMGVVFLAHDPRLKRDLAIKVIRPGLKAQPNLVERFLEEARAAARVEHDNIVTVYEADEEGGIPFLAMPLLHGEPLEARLREVNGPLGVDEVLRIGREAALGLAAAHARGLIHRDIKPANLWLEGEVGRIANPSYGKPGASATGGRIKILDFGLAQPSGFENDRGGQQAIAGTPAYMAPEQAQGQTLDGRADLFSLGCVLYRAATGKVPFDGPNTIALLVSVVTDHPPAPRTVNPRLPGEVNDLILRLLAKKPQDRPESAQAVAAAIEAIERRRHEAARPWLSRRAWLIAGAGGLATGLGLWAWLRPDTRPANVTFDFDEADPRLVLENGEKKWPIDPRQARTTSLPAGHYSVRTAEESKRRLMPDQLTVGPGEARTVKFVLVGEVRKWEVHGGSITAVTLVQNGPEVAALSASRDRRVCRWDPRSEARPTFLTPYLSPLLCLAVSADGKWAAFAGGSKVGGDLNVHLWDLAAGKPLVEPLPGHLSLIRAVAFDPTGERLLSASADGVILLWDAKKASQAGQYGHADPDRRRGQDFYGLAVSPDGRRTLAAANDGSVTLLDLKTLAPLRVLDNAHKEGARAVAFLPDGKGFVSAGKVGAIRVWDMETFQPRELNGHKEAVLCLAIAAGRLLSGGADGTLRLWNLTTGQQLLALEGHRGDVTGVALTADGLKALSGGSDGSVRWWQLPP